MRLPRPRFRIRILMILIAITALLLGAGIGAMGLVRRARYFRQMAAYHANLEKQLLGLVTLQLQLVTSQQEWARNSSLRRNWVRDLRGSRRQIHPGVEDDLARLAEMLEQSTQTIERDLRSEIQKAQFFRSLASFHTQMKQK